MWRKEEFQEGLVEFVHAVTVIQGYSPEQKWLMRSIVVVVVFFSTLSMIGVVLKGCSISGSETTMIIAR